MLRFPIYGFARYVDDTVARAMAILRGRPDYTLLPLNRSPPEKSSDGKRIMRSSMEAELTPTANIVREPARPMPIRADLLAKRRATRSLPQSTGRRAKWHVSPSP